MSDSRILSVKPIIHYPRVAQVGKTYLMTIDLEVEAGAEWQYEEEEYPIYCTVDSELFSSKPVGEPVVVMHRFGGSYGESKFLLTAIQVEREGISKITLTNRWGVEIKTLTLSSNLFNNDFVSPYVNQFKSFSIPQREEQHLSMRLEIRRSLLEERAKNFKSYLLKLEGIFNNSDVRFHIKQSTFIFLSNLSDPKIEEWNIIESLIYGQSLPLSRYAWQSLYGSKQWFKLVDALGIIEERWLRNGIPNDRNKAVSLLSMMQRDFPARVAELLEPYVDTSEDWMKLLCNLIQSSELGSERKFFSLFLRVINKGAFDIAETTADYDYSRNFWMQIYSLSEKQPEWACEAIGIYLNRQLELCLIMGQVNPFDRENGTLSRGQFEEEVLTRIADQAAHAFVQHVIPFMLRVMELTAQHEGDKPWADLVWRYRSYGSGYDLQDFLLTQMETALSNLAANNPEIFTMIKDHYLKNSDFETAQFLLIRAYTYSGQMFADEAINHLCRNPNLLEMGYSIVAGNASTATYWATRQLIEATTPYCLQQQLDSLEVLILNYYPEKELDTSFLLMRGYAQFVLLGGVARNRLGPDANRRFQEWGRKFTSAQLVESPERIDEPPKAIEARLVGSPISAEATEKMTDIQWLAAISEYHEDDMRLRFNRKGELSGGAYQLASLLEIQARKTPNRFVDLIEEFPNGTNTAYFDAVLRGLSEAQIDDVQVVIRAIKCCHNLSKKPSGIAISSLMEKQAKLSWTEEAFDILIWYALNDPDPDQESWRTPVVQSNSAQQIVDDAESSLDSNNSSYHLPSSKFYYGGDILTAGMNSVRGHSATAIAKLIFADKNRFSHFHEVLKQMVNDPFISVRACVAEALTAVFNCDRGIAINLFLNLCETEEIIYGTHTVEYFLHYALITHFDLLKPLLQKMIDSEIPAVVQVGVRQASMSALSRVEEAVPIALTCLTKEKIHRLAMSDIFAKNLRSEHCKELCEQVLSKLFNDSSQKIRSKASHCFFYFEKNDIIKHANLLDSFIQSPAFFDGLRDLIYALEKSTSNTPEIIYEVCNRFVQGHIQESTLNNHFFGMKMDTLSKMLIRAYSESENPILKSRCLDLIDSMVESEVYGLDKALEEFEL
jgi:hypothetical protein